MSRALKSQATRRMRNHLDLPLELTCVKARVIPHTYAADNASEL